MKIRFCEDGVDVNVVLGIRDGNIDIDGSDVGVIEGNTNIVGTDDGEDEGKLLGDIVEVSKSGTHNMQSQ